MKKYSLEKFKERKKHKKMTKITIIIILAVILLILVALYMANRQFRTFIDTYILRKSITEENANSLIIDTDNLSLVHAFDRKLVTYDDGNVNFYNSSAKKIGNIEITLSKPIADSDKKYLALGDYESQKICLIKDTNLIWQKDIEGKISKISVNENGYVAVSVTGTTYESIVMLYNEKGDLLFTKFLSTYVIAIDISKNNDYLAIAQIDNAGITQTVKVEMVSIEQAMTNPENATINTYQAETNEAITGINFQNKNNLLCSFDTYILRMTEATNEKIYELTDLTAYVDIKLKNNFIRVDKEESSVFKSDYRLKIASIDKKEKVYIIEGSLKSVTTKDNMIALNLGKEVDFINNKGKLVKKYISTQEIENLIVSDNIGAVIYKDKITIINL